MGSLQQESSPNTLASSEPQSSTATSQVRESFDSEQENEPNSSKDHEVPALRAQLEKMEERLGSQKERFARLSFVEQTLQAHVNSLVQSLDMNLLTQQETIEKMTQENIAQRKNLGVLIQYLHAPGTACPDAIYQFEVAIERQDDMIKRLREEFNAQQEESLVKLISYKVQLADDKSSLQALIAGLDKGSDDAQEVAKKQEPKLEEIVDAEQEPEQEAT